MLRSPDCPLALRNFPNRREADLPDAVDAMFALCEDAARPPRNRDPASPERLLFEANRDHRLRSPDRRALRRLLRTLFRDAPPRRTGRLLRGRQAVPRLGDRAGNTFVEALAAVAAGRRRWVRPVETFEPPRGEPREVFSALLRHLFATYEVPRVLDEAWFLGAGPDARLRRGWFLHAAGGRSVRECNLPFPLTRRAAHLFASVEGDFSVDEALRYAQAAAAGASPELAKAIATSGLARLSKAPDYWRSVVEWLAAAKGVNPRLAVTLIRRLRLSQTAGRPVAVRGRTAASMLRATSGLAADETHGAADWPASGLAEWRETAGATEWRVAELLSADALREEGRSLRHCVGGYAGRCVSGVSSVWSLTVGRADDPESAERCATVEVCGHTRTIRQVRGVLNRPMVPAERRVLLRWADAAGLSLAPDA